MHPTSALAHSARAFVLTGLKDMGEQFDGYPAQSLLEDCLAVFDAEAVIRLRTHRLVEHLLTTWSETLTRDLEQFPVSTLESIRVIRQRMVNARDALLNAKAILHGLGGLAERAVAGEDEDEHGLDPSTLRMIGLHGCDHELPPLVSTKNGCRGSAAA